MAPTRRSRTRVLARPLALALGLAAAGTPAAAPAQTVRPAAYAGMRWRSIGPYRSGNVYSVSGIPGNPDIYYLGLPEGGVWKTVDAGTVWKPVFDSAHVASIGAVAVAPSAPNTVYVGTGDPTGWSFTPGNGVYKSADGGVSWHHLGLDETRYITALIVDPRDPNIVLVGALGTRAGGGSSTARGVYRTTDGGRTWKHVLYVDAFTGIADMTADADEPGVVYAAFQRSAFGLTPADRDSLRPLGTGIYRSADEGATWHPIAGTGLPAGTQGYEIATATGTRGRRVYAEARGSGRDASGLYRSDDGGRTWQLGTRQILSAGGPIYVDPQHPDVLYLMGTAVYRSTDGGRHVEAYKGSPGGDDPRDMWIDPANSQRMILGVDQGPTISVDGGRTWTPWYNMPNGQFYRVSTDRHWPYRVCAPQQDSGTACVLSRSDFGAIRDKDWTPVGGFEDGFIVTDPTNDRWVYTQGWYHVLRRYDRETGQVAVLYTPSPEDRFGGAPPLAFSPQDPRVLYMGAQYVLASSDSARTWRRLSPDLTTPRAGAPAPAAPVGPRRGGPSIEALAPSTVAAGEIWVGTSNGQIQLTRDGGASWTNVTPPDMPARGSINVLDVSHANAGTAYAAVLAFGDAHPYIFRTTDFGATWHLVVSGLPNDAAVRTVREDPADPTIVYAGTVTGAWVSFDQGDHWQSLQLNLPTTVVSDLDVHGTDLVASTYGRGLWILDDLSPLRQAHDALASSQPYLYAPDTAVRVRWDNIEDTPLPPEVPAGQNPPEGAIIDYYLSAPASGGVTLSVYDDGSHLVRQYSSAPAAPDTSPPNIPTYWFRVPVVLPTTPGMHRIAWDLRYPEPPVLNYGYFGGLLDYTEYTLNVHAIEGETPRRQPTGPLVAPGTYRVRLTVNGHTDERTLVVRNDPRVPLAQEALDAQARFQQRLVAGMSVSYDQFNRLAEMRRVLATDSARTTNVGLRGDIQSLDQRLAALASGPRGAFGTANRDLTRNLEDQESGDVDPTPSDVAAADASCKDIDEALSALSRLETTDIAALNAKLGAAHLPGIAAGGATAAAGCDAAR
ncbi:MAG TPA: hypothetical protein VF118_06665 [Gemmatimonadaceae bacterium]